MPLLQDGVHVLEGAARARSGVRGVNFWEFLDSNMAPIVILTVLALVLSPVWLLILAAVFG